MARWAPDAAGRLQAAALELFSGQDLLQEFLADWIQSQINVDDPIETVIDGLSMAASHFPAKTPLSVKRSAIIAANGELRERELQKLASLATVISDSLRQAGIDASKAEVAAEIGTLIFKLGYQRWIVGASESLEGALRGVFTDLKSVVTEEAAPAPVLTRQRPKVA